MDVLILELQRKDAENQASYDNLSSPDSPTTTEGESSYDLLKTQVDAAKDLTIKNVADSTDQLEEIFA